MFYKTIGAHWVEELAAMASLSGSLDTVPKSSVTTSRMEDNVHASADERYLGF
jgi:hypothetical protein